MTKTKTNDSRRQAAFVWHFENLNFDIVSDFKCRDFEFRIYYTLILVTFGTDKNPAQTGLTFKTGKYGKGFHDGAPAILIKGQTRGPAPTRNLFPIGGRRQ